MAVVPKPSLLIEIPLDDGWTVNSPSDAKSRLEAHSPKAKSPEALARDAEKAQALHQLHIDAVKRRAQRDLERVAEAERRRIRNEAAEKQRILEKAAQGEKRANDKKEALEAKAAEKKARREALKEAFFESRDRMAAAHHQREAMLAERLGNAAAKREKMLQATVHKANYEVKHALAVATAAKEKERAAAAQASTSLDERMTAASLRRMELLGASPPSSLASSSSMDGSSFASYLKSPAKSPTKTTRARARQVFQVLNDEAVALEQKRKALSDAMDKALGSRNARLEATVRRAASYKEKAARAKEALAKRQASADELAHQIVEKAQAAEVRRMFHLKAPVHKKMSPCFLEIALDRRPGVTGPSSLIARLSIKANLLASELTAKCQAAVARRDRILFDKMTKLTAAVACSERAAARRAASLESSRAKIDAKMAHAAIAVADAKSKRVATALKMNARVDAATSKRLASRCIHLAVLACRAEKHEQAMTTRALFLNYDNTYSAAEAGAAQRERANAVAFRRTGFHEAVLKRHQVSAKRLEDAAMRRATTLASRVARAKMSAIPRTAAVKLTAIKLTAKDGGCGIHVSVLAPGEKKNIDGEASVVVPNTVPPVHVQADAAAEFVEQAEAVEKAAAVDKPNNRGVIGRVFGRIFGY